MKIDKKYYPSLARLFSPVVLDSLAVAGHSSYLSEVCVNSGLLEQIDLSMTLSQFFDRIYSMLFKNYRNEYIYKNVIANKILLGKHSLITSHMFTEFRVGKCKADVVILNGTSTVYEIKSEFDSFVRLENQIQTYFQVFDHINVITTASQAVKLKSILPDAAGILVLTDRNTISTIRESKSNKENTNLGILFNSFRKNEYLKIIKEYYGILPDVPNTSIHRECKRLFCDIPLPAAHGLAIRTLKNRNKSRLLKDSISIIPTSLSAYALSISSETSKIQAFMPKLSLNIGSVLITKSI